MIVIASLYLPSTRSKQAGSNWQNFAKSRNTAAPSAVPTSAGSKGLSVEDKAKEWTKKNLKPGGELSAKAPAAVVKGSVSPWDAFKNSIIEGFKKDMQPGINSERLRSVEKLDAGVSPHTRTSKELPLLDFIYSKMPDGMASLELKRKLSTPYNSKNEWSNTAQLHGVKPDGSGSTAGAYTDDFLQGAWNTLKNPMSLLGKQGSVSPWDAALRLGLLGAGGGLAFQGLRKLMQSKRDEEEEGSPSLLKGMLLGGLLGAGGGAGIAHLLNRGQAPDSPPEMLGAGHDVAGAAPSATEIPAESLQAQMAQARPNEMRTPPPLGRKSETALQDAGKSSISPQFSAGQATTPQLSLADLANMQSVVGPNGEFKFGEFEAPRTMTGSGSHSVPNAVPMDFPMFHRRRS